MANTLRAQSWAWRMQQMYLLFWNIFFCAKPLLFHFSPPAMTLCDSTMCVPLDFPFHMHTVLNIIPRCIYIRTRNSLHLLDGPGTRDHVILWSCASHTCVLSRLCQWFLRVHKAFWDWCTHRFLLRILHCLLHSWSVQFQYGWNSCSEAERLDNTFVLLIRFCFFHQEADMAQWILSSVYFHLSCRAWLIAMILLSLLRKK